jgi:Ca-activated chloride channel family protein
VAQASGQRKYLQYEGQEVWSKLDGELLEKIALETGGAYIPAGTRAYDLGQLYEQHLVDLNRGEYRQEKRRLLKEQFQWPLAFGVVLLMIEILIPTYLRPRQIVGKGAADDA